jgi:hypothetical protein
MHSSSYNWHPSSDKLTVPSNLVGSVRRMAAHPSTDCSRDDCQKWRIILGQHFNKTKI